MTQSVVSAGFFLKGYIKNIIKFEVIPLLEVPIKNSTRETFSADSDTLKDTVTPELVDDQEVLHLTCQVEISSFFKDTFSLF